MSEWHVQFLEERLHVYLLFRLFRNKLRQRFANVYLSIRKIQIKNRKERKKQANKQINILVNKRVKNKYKIKSSLKLIKFLVWKVDTISLKEFLSPDSSVYGAAAELLN